MVRRAWILDRLCDRFHMCAFVQDVLTSIHYHYKSSKVEYIPTDIFDVKFRFKESRQ